jgi:3-oxocholest-4-en-26-oate---CoA ligase
MTDWNYADLWTRIARGQRSAPAIIQGDITVRWGQFDDDARSFAGFLAAHSVASGSKVATFLYNHPAYLIGVFGTLLARGIPVNTNYRYGQGELIYLFDNADAEVLIFDAAFTDRVDAVRGHLPQLRTFVCVGSPCPPWATPWSDAVAHDPLAPGDLSGDDLFFLYTGGTTGMPKGVMWRQDDLFARLNTLSLAAHPDVTTTEELASAMIAEGPGGVGLPACPLMHGTGLFSAMTTFCQGGCVVLLTDHHYDPAELARTIEQHGVQVIAIVGDPFARPLLRLLDATPGRYDVSSLVSIVSSGAMWSQEIKTGLLAHQPTMILLDAFSSSEALGMGQSISGGGAAETTARFTLGPLVRVATEDGRAVAAGSGGVGWLMLGGRNPLGYYKDEAKTDATFRVIDGVRYSVPGDMALVNADGSIQLLGRGSQCINSGGEKIFPEEVEEALKTHQSVADACVVGVPDEEFGQRVVASVELHDGQSCDEATLLTHVRENLAGYKAPRTIRFVDTIGRASNGKMEYSRHQDEMAEWVLRRTN